MPQDWYAQREQRFVITGPVGGIELLVNGVAAPRALALICHPHPLHGGTLDNKVVFTLARACRDSGIVAVRFNFRGVGRSEGLHDDGKGECDDARFLLKQLCGALPGLPVVLAGFSFGAAIAASLVEEQGLCDRLILVAPPVPRYGLDGVGSLPCPVLLLQGDDDEVIESADVYQWFDALRAPQKNARRWPQAGHFFHGVLPELKEAAVQFLSAVPGG